MAIDTKSVATRRQVHYNRLEDIIADAECMVDCNARTVGNWSRGQIFRHLATAMNQSIDGMDLTPPWFLRLGARLLKKRLLTKPLSPGFRLPRKTKLLPEPVSDQQGLQELREAVARLRADSTRKPSPLLGDLSLEEWDQLHCRHAELHMSFIVPDE